MVLGQSDAFQLLPDAAELIWGAVATVLILVVVLVLGFVFYRAVSGAPRRRDTRRLRELEDRVTRLEGDHQDVQPRVDT
jgi:hypothetical protein